MKPLIPLLLCLSALLLSCGGEKIRHQLLEIGERTDHADPARAMAMLDSINPFSLTENELYFLDLLRLRIADNAERRRIDGISFQNLDTLIQPLHDYVADHPDCGFYPEALCYAGRFYAEIGDSYRALTICQKALKALDRESPEKQVRRKLLSQTAALLHSMRHNNTATEYLTEALRLDSLLSDDIAMMEDRISLGAIYLSDGFFNMATPEFETAREIAAKASPLDTSVIDIYLAEIDYHDYKWPRALARIRSAVRNVREPYRKIALGEAAFLYHHFNIPDTAAMFAVELAKTEDNLGIGLGHALLQFPGISNNVPLDSSGRRGSFYLSAESYKPFLNENRRRSLMQTSLYNYTVHDRLRHKAERRSQIYGYLAFGAVIMALLFIVSYLMVKSKRKQTLLDLHEAIEKVESLNAKIFEKETRSPESPTPSTESPIPEEDNHHTTNNVEEEHEPEKLEPEKDETEKNDSKKKKILIEKLKANLLARFENQPAGTTEYEVPDTILRSEAYKNLQRQIKLKKPVVQESKLWKQIERAVCKTFPDFKRDFSYLTGPGMTMVDYHTALLIKCGIKPSDMATVLSIELSSVSSRRSTISGKIYGRNVGTATIDAIIRSL